MLPFVVTVFCGRLGNDVMGGHGLAFAVSAHLNAPLWACLVDISPEDVFKEEKKTTHNSYKVYF